MQRMADALDKMAGIGRKSVRDHLTEQHRLFYPQLPFIVLGTVDRAGDAWASIRAGRPGFLNAASDKRLDLLLARDAEDPAEGGLEDGAGIGLLGIELQTRRRNRLNGTLRVGDEARFAVEVEHAFGNCPQYIQTREFSFARDPSVLSKSSPSELSKLDGQARELVRGADTFFVASYITDSAGCRKVDVSHRGGRSGFVRLDPDGGLTIPDFAGNLFFNTLGNLLVNPKAGLAFPDFGTGDLLQMTGDAEVLLEPPGIGVFLGAQRLWRFRPRKIVLRPDALPLRWRFSEWSPKSLMTGSWQNAR